MPNIKSAEKRVRVSRKKKDQNTVVKSAMKTNIKKFEQASTDKEAAYSAVASVIDKAAAKGVIHKNTANRKKARLAKKIAVKK
ncbi:MAG: 30S ribosomal protein S20 [Christensenellales bacterium]